MKQMGNVNVLLLRLLSWEEVGWLIAFITLVNNV